MAVTQATVFSLFILISVSDITNAESPCGDWEPYKEENCLKIFEEAGLVNYSDAENFCRIEQDAHLISIGLEEKQVFIDSFIKSKDIVDNVWIGLVYGNGTYEWSDGTESHYSNWAEGSPKNSTDDCVQIETGDTTFGKWSDVLCVKKNLIICEKLQLWSLTSLQTAVMDLQYNFGVSKSEIGDLQTSVKEMKNSIKELESSVGKLKDEVAVISKETVPVGFIYVQLPDQLSPSEIWSSMQWEDVSSKYAGLFFRVYGGNSASFGTTQSENAPRLVSLKVDYGETQHPGSDVINISADDTWSDVLSLWGDDWGQKLYAKASSGEVRPRNTAIKVWRRKS